MYVGCNLNYLMSPYFPISVAFQSPILVQLADDVIDICCYGEYADHWWWGN